MKIVFAHLLNDYSGSPLILSSIIKGVREKGYEVDLFTCGDNEGFLSNLDVNYYHFPYRFFVNKYIRLVAFMASQMILFLKIIFRYWNQKDVIIYVNTLLPFGASLAGRVLGKRVVYHIHEISLKPPSFKTLLKTLAEKTASTAIYVSHDLMKQEKLPNVNGKVVYNGISNDFIAKANTGKKSREDDKFRVLMLCSLKDYKGVPEFVELSKRLPNYEFELVVNATNSEIKNYFGTIPTQENLTIYPVQKDVHPFYQRADLVLNLSHPETWVETFGMTILEAMYYGIPCIIPPVGGPIELVDNGKEGFQVDQRNLEKVIETIELIATDKDLYDNLSTNALQKAHRFTIENMIEGAVKTIKEN